MFAMSFIAIESTARSPVSFCHAFDVVHRFDSVFFSANYAGRMNR